MDPTDSSHSFLPNSVDTMSANSGIWDSPYTDNAWASASSYPPSGTPITTDEPWLQQVLSNRSHACLPLMAGQSSSTMISPPSSHHTEHMSWSTASPNGYMSPDGRPTAYPSNTILHTPIDRILSLNSSPDGLSDTFSCGNPCSHGTGLHSSQSSGIEYVPPKVTPSRSFPDKVLTSSSVSPFSRYKCHWEGCTYTGAFSRQTCLWRHIKSTHVAPEEYRCPAPECKETFGRKDKLKSHMRLYHITHGHSEQCSCRS